MNTNQIRVVTFGELLLRISPMGAERLLQSPALQTYVGGSEANVAVSLARLGINCRYITCVPDNALGAAAVRGLQAQGVDISFVKYGGHRLGLYFVEPAAQLRPIQVIYDRTPSAFSEASADSFDWPKLLEEAAWLHLSGITPALSNRAATMAHDAASAAHRAGIPISLDLNYRAALWQDRDPRSLIRPLAKLSRVLIGNSAAVIAMLGVPGDRPQLARDLHTEFGCATIALTHRAPLSPSEHDFSARLFDAAAAHEHRSAVYRMRPVDRVGSGDAFAAGLIHALIAGKDAQSALDFATAAGVMKLTIPGDWNLASAAEIEALIQRAHVS